MKHYILIDVGGTEIKVGTSDENGNLAFDEVLSYNSRSSGTKEDVIDNFVNILYNIMTKNNNQNTFFDGIGFAFPGPFDYENGVCLLEGLGKFESIYGVNIKDAIINKLRSLPELANNISDKTKYSFINDIEAVAVGEANYGVTKDFKRVMYICIGTGLGSSFTIDKSVVKGAFGIPNSGWIYNTPFKDGVIDDYISVRGLANLTKSVIGHELTGKELFLLSKNGDEKSLEIWKIFGQDLKESICEFIESFSPDMLYIGGQIVKSFEYFGDNISNYCLEKNVKIVLSPSSSKSALLGCLPSLIKKG